MLTQCQVFGKAVCGISASCARELFSRKELVGRQVTDWWRPGLGIVWSQNDNNQWIHWLNTQYSRKKVDSTNVWSRSLRTACFSVSHSTRHRSSLHEMLQGQLRREDTTQYPHSTLHLVTTRSTKAISPPIGPVLYRLSLLILNVLTLLQSIIILVNSSLYDLL